MTLIDVIVKSSIQIFQADEKIMKPEGFGTGFIGHYLDQSFLISVSHVTNNDDLTTFLETNLPPENNTVSLKPLGSFIFYDLLKVSEDIDLKDFEDLIDSGGERLDITFAKIDNTTDLKQPFIDFGPFQVNEGSKIALNLDTCTAFPEIKNTYAFYGKIRHKYEGENLKMTPALKNDLKYHRTKGDFHIFLAPKIISDKEDYEGCSGAPIFDNEGKIVAIACHIRNNTKMIYGFSIQKCMQLIKLAVETNQI